MQKDVETPSRIDTTPDHAVNGVANCRETRSKPEGQLATCFSTWLGCTADAKGVLTSFSFEALDQQRSKVGMGVAGDPAYGNDSPLYGAMGFVRKSEKKSGLTRKKKA